MKRIMLLLVLIGALAFSVPASAVPVYLTYTGIEDYKTVTPYFGTDMGYKTVYAGLMNFTIKYGSGTTYLTQGFCIDPSLVATSGLQYDLRTIAEGSDYEKAAYLFANTTEKNYITQIAIWELTIPGFIYSGPDYLAQVNTLIHTLDGVDFSAFDQSAYRLAVNPIGATPGDGQKYQDYLVKAVPEPGTLLLLGFGLVGLGVCKRRFK